MSMEVAERRIQKAKEKGHTTLDLSHLRLSALPDSFTEIAQLHELNLRHNQLTSLPDTIDRFKELKKLDAGVNNLSVLPNSIGSLKYLKELNVSYNKLAKLPNSIGLLQNLQSFHASNNSLIKLPDSIGSLLMLEDLNLLHNQITELPDSICSLTKILYLDVKFNKLTKLPLSIGSLTNLKTLNLEHNRLTSLPRSFRELTNLREWRTDYSGLVSGISLIHNQLAAPPQDTAEQGFDAIVNYFKQVIEYGETEHRQLKLQIIGNPFAGKTTLFNLLAKYSSPEYQEIPTGDDDRTYGVNVYRDWEFEKDEENYSANIWDFGGQKIQYMTHQFLLSEKSLFVLVLDHEKVEDNTDYWFQFLDLLDETSPIIIVVNHKQHLENQPVLDIKHYNNIYNRKKLIQRDTNLKNQYQTIALIDEFQQQISHFNFDTLPKPWPKIEQKLLELDKSHITLDEFVEFCRNREVLGELALNEINDIQHFLNDYLRIMGTVIYYPNSLLANTVFLKPDWIANAIYHVFRQTEIEDNFGKVSKQRLMNIWSNVKDEYNCPCYSTSEINMFIELLLRDRFDVCYELADKEQLIMPMWLPKHKPIIKIEETNILHYRFEYPLLPFGFISHLMVHFHDELYSIDGFTLHWRNGFVLHRHENDEHAYAIIERSKVDNMHRIEIISSGDLRLRKQIKMIIVEELEKLHKKFKLTKQQKWISKSIACYGCLKEGLKPKFHLVDDYLQSHRQNDEGIYSESITCTTCGQDIIPEILEGNYEINTPQPEDKIDQNLTRLERAKRIIVGSPYVRYGGMLIAGGLLLEGAPWWIPYLIEFLVSIGILEEGSTYQTIQTPPYLGLGFSFIGAIILLYGMRLDHLNKNE